MKPLAKTLAIATTILAAAPAWAQSEASDGDTMDQLSGAWRMVSLEAGNSEGELEPVEYSGQIVFTDAGTMSVQASDPDADAAPTPYAVNGYEAANGRFVIDEGEQAFVFTVESSLVRDLIGQELERAFEISDGRLVLTPTNPEENWRVVYERY